MDVAHQHKHHHSRAAEFEGFYDDGMTRGSSPEGYTAGDEERQLTGSREKFAGGWGRMFGGWRGGLFLNFLLSGLIFLIGLVCLIVAIAKSEIAERNGVLYSGSCGTAARLNWGLHAAIGIFVIVLIAGANYAFQVLSSPTRAELAVAHANTKWVDIGVPSVRNFAHIASSRVVLAVTLLLSAVVTQIM